jgi:NAD dependent epimerase/dehydratase
MTWSGRKVLVTGAGGFIGSHLTEALVEHGADVRALVEYVFDGSHGWLDRSPARHDVEVIAGDVRDPDSAAHAVRGTEIVFHLAALISIPYSYDAPLSYFRTNVEGTLNILRASLRADVRLVVHTSTSEVYGTARSVPIAEAHPLQAQSPYAASKIAADKAAEAFHLSYGLPVTTLRPFNTFGPRQSARAVIPTIATQALDGDRIRLGNLTPTRDFTYVEDTARAFVHAAEAPAAIGRVVNIGSGKEIAIGELAEAICRLAGGRAQVVHDEQRVRPPLSEVERLLADTTLARELLGWRPEIGLEQGLERTLAWLGENLEHYRVGAYVV